MDPNEEKCREIVAAYRQERVPPDVRAAAWERLQSAIVAGERPATIQGDRRRDAVWAAALLVAAALVVLFSWRGRLSGRDEGEAGSQAAHGAPATTDTLAPVTGDRGQASAPVEAVAPVPVEATGEPSEPRRSPPKARVVNVPKDRTDLDAELALLRAAREALGRGAPAEALAQTTEHERAFPAGFLQEERMLLRARAECELGRRDAARATAAALVRAFPGSPHARTVASVCADQPAP